MGPIVVEATKYALGLRYQIIPYLYTLFYRATNFGDTVMRPLFFENPLDEKTYEVEDQFMLGSSLMVIPGLYEGVTEYNPYFPEGLWYDDEGLLIDSSGERMARNISIDRIILARRGGSIIVGHPPKQTTTAQRKEDFILTVYLDKHEKASGELYWDDGESIDNILLGDYSLVNFDVSGNKLSSQAELSGYAEGMSAKYLNVYGLDKDTKITGVTINGAATQKFSFNGDVLNVFLDGLSLLDTNSIIWSL
jgi:alpha-glucosidase (family GH31 glycosyl hydrolase)